MYVSKGLIYIEPQVNSGMVVCHLHVCFYEGYCVGTCLEYPGIILSGKNEEDLANGFEKLYHSYKKALEHYGIKNKPDRIIPVAVDDPC